MSSTNLELFGCKKRKRLSFSTLATAGGGDRAVFRFKSFGENGYPAEFNGSFLKNVRALLELGRMESSILCNGLVSWSFQLEVHRHRPDRTVFLFVVEEPVEASGYRHCKHCQYVGWGHHMICNMNYHFVVPSKETAATVVAATCLGCQEGDCCDGGVSLATRSGANKKQTFNLVELDGHALHGVFHCNGFGHLICINGVEMGNELTGQQIMDFWDRLCVGLRARRVSLTDTSCKRGMELRLIHGVGYAGPWFQRWGYQFTRGSFGVTPQMYQKAIQALQNVPLCLLLPHLGQSDHNVALIFTRYQALSDHSLITIGELFQFMFELNSKLPKDPSSDNGIRPPPEATNCRWSPKRVEMATRAIVDALRRSEFKWVSRQEVRDAARNYIGDTGLLDFVLKSLGNHVVGNYLVRRSLNPVTKVLEYCLEDISGAVVNGQLVEVPKRTYTVSKSQLAKDIFYLYKCIFMERKSGSSNNNGLLSAIPIATSIILDSKFFTKEFCTQMVAMNDDSIEVNCSLQIKNIQEKTVPNEVFIVKSNTATQVLKREAESRFRELYWGMKGLIIEGVSSPISTLLGWEEETVSRLVIEAGNELILEGRVNEGELQGAWQSSHGAVRYVDCICGAKDDDGERMVACDICEVWQHTRCLRIPSNEEIPKIFICNRCEQEIVFSPGLL